ncbi:MAG: hypothetical protein COU25_01400 [Candidatus Levybacteria bacterium CG10_big_fil_rev_8_21_14_0_10_35_13]|nr:MAG: hypothetical protein COU25_01400 [Candidatus Levybacteria bacterium CG10_big_fil_rev_8_21_14_0_10_35_13]
MNKYNFKKYEGNFPRGGIKISINRPGVLRLSSAFCNTTNITKYEYAELFYDESNNAIAIHPTHEFYKGVARITKDKKAAAISINLFMRANKLDINDYAGRYDFIRQILEGIGEVFIIELKNKK